MADHKTRDIRKFITQTFGDEELDVFCYDYFREIHEEFAIGMSKTQKVQRLIEGCERRGALPNLLAALREERREQYDVKLGQPIAVTPTQEAVCQRDPRQVFINHAHEDAQFAHRLATDLEAQGWRAWIAPDSIRPGEKWASAINRGLEECSAFVVALTPTAVVSNWVVDETNIAIEFEHKGLLKFIPVEVQSCKTPPLWSAYQFISFRNDYKTGLSALLAELATYLATVVHAASPQGQAIELYERIKKSPPKLLVEIGDVLAHLENRSEVLLELLVLCRRERRQGASGIAEVVQGYTFLLGGPGQWEAGLDSLQIGLAAITGAEAQEDTLAVCKLLGAAFAANSVTRIAALRSQLEAAQSMTGAAVPGFPDLKGVLAHWAQIVDDVEIYQKSPIIEEKVRYLSHAITDLGQVDREITSTLGEPMRSMLDEIMARWLSSVNNALDELHGCAFLQISLPARQLLALDDVVVALALHNWGTAEAQNVRVELLPSEDYEILAGASIVVGTIPITRSSSVEFHVRPLAKKKLRAEFQISYDDQRRTGRSIPFADQVFLVQVTEEYQPIPDPYQAGRPLPQGSPLFFGFDDVFAFIAEKIGGPSLDNVLLLVGQRRCGKTSLLKQLANKLDRRYIPVYIDGQQLGVDPGMADLFYGLSRVIASSISAVEVEVVAPTLEEFEVAPSVLFEREFLARLQATLGERRLLLAFDEFEEIERLVREGHIEPDIFPFLRHLMQHSEKLSFIFVGTHKLEELSKDYWSIFFDVAYYREIRFLDDEAASQLIREPVAPYGLLYDDLAVKRILGITAGHPFFVQLVCHVLVNTANASQSNYITVEDVGKVIDEVTALGSPYFMWLWEAAVRSEKLVMATLANLLCGQPTVTSSAISRLLTDQRQYSVYLDPAEVSDVLDRLAARDIVDEIPDHTLQYRFKLELLSLWIRRNRPLSMVIEAFGELRTPRQSD